jgi:hypothetical protein
MKDSEIKQIEEAQLDYKETKKFLHCKNCIEQFLGSELNESMTPRDYGIYEVGICDFLYPDGTRRDVIVMWCRRCGRKVWDSRSFMKIY